jgi:RNA polymerase sigma-70 factor (ECF subfamily)
MVTDSQERSEADLVRGALGGEVGAFEQLMARYERAVFNVALYKAKNYFDAEDLTQDIFLAAFEALGTLKTPESFAGWLFGIAYNRCHKWFQRERNKILKIEEIRARMEREDRQRMRPGAPPVTAGGQEEETVLSDVFARLPAEVREALTLKFLDGLSYEEIEKRLGINFHRIDYLIRKGKQMIRQRLEKSAEGGGP